jgi:hypothetical protein
MLHVARRKVRLMRGGHCTARAELAVKAEVRAQPLKVKVFGFMMRLKALTFLDVEYCLLGCYAVWFL